MTKKEHKLFSFLIFLIMILLVLLLGGCGPAHHLQRMEYHKNQAIKKGAKLEQIMKTFHFKSPEIKFETTLKPTWLDGAPIPLWRDTLSVEDKKTGAIVKAKIDLKDDCPEDCIETVYLAADVPPQDGKAEAPCGDKISAGHTTWEMIILAIACLAAGAVLGRLFWK